MTHRLYVGDVLHRRLAPKPHVFRYGLYLAYIDLSDTARVFAKGWAKAARRLGLVGFRESDYLTGKGNDDLPLLDRVCRWISDRTGAPFTGKVHLLTSLRHLGFAMNPISVFYCHDQGGVLRYVLAEVSNTPWNERHHYLLEVSAGGRSHRFRVPKEFHVSPFMGMEMEYRWTLNDPAEALVLGVANHDGGGKVFEATLALRGLPWTGRNLARVMIRYPLMTYRVIGGIYWQALRLFAKRLPFFSHPGRLRPAGMRSFHENTGS